MWNLNCSSYILSLYRLLSAMISKPIYFIQCQSTWLDQRNSVVFFLWGYVRVSSDLCIASVHSFQFMTILFCYTRKKIIINYIWLWHVSKSYLKKKKPLGVSLNSPCAIFDSTISVSHSHRSCSCVGCHFLCCTYIEWDVSILNLSAMYKCPSHVILLLQARRKIS